MLDVTLIRQHPDQVLAGLRKRGADPDIPAFLALDAEFRETRAAVERLRGARRRISAEIAARRRTDAPADELRDGAGELAGRL
ncbi:serine--tRNA ligase, partial [Streptomyces chartreusis]